MAGTAQALSVENVGKNYGAVEALSDVNLHLEQGEVLGLIGDNGAGKSTLIKILSGFHAPTTGRILLDGEPVQLRSVQHARSMGIDTVFQDLALVNELSVYHNMFLKRELSLGPFLRNGAMRKRARSHLEDIGIQLPSVDVPVAKLSGGQRQAIAVARSVYSNSSVLLLDEPLAAMGAREGRLILDLVRRLKERGEISIIIIAHNYAQVLDVCDRVNLLRHGAITFDRPTSQVTLQQLTDLVVSEYRGGGGEEEPENPAAGESTDEDSASEESPTEGGSTTEESPAEEGSTTEEGSASDEDSDSDEGSASDDEAGSSGSRDSSP